MSKKLELYKKLMKAADIIVNDDGALIFAMGEQRRQVTKSGTYLYLEVPGKAEPTSSYEYFDPMPELLLSSSNPFIERYRQMITIRLNLVISQVIYQLLTVAAEPQKFPEIERSKLNTLTRIVGEVDDKTRLVWARLISSMVPDDEGRTIVSLAIRHAGHVASRATTVTFPMYNRLCNINDYINNVPMRLRDRKAFINLLDYVLPEQGYLGSYNAMSDNPVSPSLDTLMISVKRMADQINKVIDLYPEIMDADLRLDVEWESPDFTILQD